MNELLVTVINSAKQLIRAQAVNTNNLANASTDGFKSEIAYISSMELGGGVESMPDLSTGAVRTTGRDLDVSINGKGWITIMAADGSEGYSRRGDLKVDAVGQLTDGAGHPIIGNSGPVALPPFTAVEIASDGTISIQPLGQTPNTMAVVDRIKLVSVEDSDLYRGDDGVMRARQEDLVSVDASIRLISGSIEGSNVNAVSEMVKMIDLARRFEAQVQLMHSANENARALSSVLSMS